MQVNNLQKTFSETKYIIVTGKIQSDYIVEFYDSQDNLIKNLTIDYIRVGMLINNVLEDYENITIYNSNLSQVMIPSNEKLYEELNL